MKKLYAILASALMILTANAQNFKVVLEDESEVENGATITVYAQEVRTEYKPGKFYSYISCDPEYPYVVNLTGSTINVSGTVTAATQADDQNVQWCGFDAQCNPISTEGLTKNTEIEANQKASMQIHGSFLAIGEYKTYTALVTLSCGAQTFNFTEKFVYDEEHSSGISNVKMDIATAQIYDIQGRKTAAENLIRGQVYVINGKRCLITK